MAQALAEHGYIVAAVNHPGNNALEPWSSSKDYTERLSRVLPRQAIEKLPGREELDLLNVAEREQVPVARNDDGRSSRKCRIDELVIVGILSDPARPSQHRNGFGVRAKSIDDDGDLRSGHAELVG